jgi:hypothetical protein
LFHYRFARLESDPGSIWTGQGQSGPPLREQLREQQKLDCGTATEVWALDKKAQEPHLFVFLWLFQLSHLLCFSWRDAYA